MIIKGGGDEQESRMGVAGMPNSRFPIKWVTLRCFAGATTVKGKMGRKKALPQTESNFGNMRVVKPGGSVTFFTQAIPYEYFGIKIST